MYDISTSSTIKNNQTCVSMYPIYKPVPYQLHVGWNNSHVELLCSWKTHFRYVNAGKLGLNSQHGVLERIFSILDSWTASLEAHPRWCGRASIDQTSWSLKWRLLDNAVLIGSRKWGKDPFLCFHTKKCWSRRQCVFALPYWEVCLPSGLLGPQASCPTHLCERSWRVKRDDLSSWQAVLATSTCSSHWQTGENRSRAKGKGRSISTRYVLHLFSRVWLRAHLVDTPKKRQVNWSLRGGVQGSDIVTIVSKLVHYVHFTYLRDVSNLLPVCRGYNPVTKYQQDIPVLTFCIAFIRSIAINFTARTALVERTLWDWA